MKPDLARQFGQQLAEIVAKFKEFRNRCPDGNFMYMDGADLQWLLMQGRSAIDRIARGSVYHKHAENLFNLEQYDGVLARKLLGVLEGLLSDLTKGYLASFAELVHAEVFADFLEMGSYLQQEGYKDAAAVITGSSLEAHLRQLCVKHGVPDSESDSKGISRPKKADKMNSDLAGAGVYSKGDQKSVTAWLAIRNDAAHAHYGNYTSDQVSLMISAVRDFLIRNPA